MDAGDIDGDDADEIAVSWLYRDDEIVDLYEGKLQLIDSLSDGDLPEDFDECPYTTVTFGDFDGEDGTDELLVVQRENAESMTPTYIYEYTASVYSWSGSALSSLNTFEYHCEDGALGQYTSPVAVDTPTATGWTKCSSTPISTTISPTMPITSTSASAPPSD